MRARSLLAYKGVLSSLFIDHSYTTASPALFSLPREKSSLYLYSAVSMLLYTVHHPDAAELGYKDNL